MTALGRHNGKHKRPCNFAIFQDKKYKFGKLGYFNANFSKNYIIPNSKLLWHHNRYFSRPYNFAIFEGISSRFGNLRYFDMFIKVSVFHKYCFIY